MLGVITVLNAYLHRLMIAVVFVVMDFGIRGRY